MCVCLYQCDCQNITALEVVLLALATEDRKMGLRINEKKIKYMKITSIQARRYLQNLTICDFKFEGVNSYTRLGSVVNSENKMWSDFHSKIITANQAYIAHSKLFRSKPPNYIKL